MRKCAKSILVQWVYFLNSVKIISQPNKSDYVSIYVLVGLVFGFDRTVLS